MRHNLRIQYVLVLALAGLLPITVAASPPTITLCRDYDLGTGVKNPTTIFATDTPAIHAIVDRQELSGWGRVRGRWISVDAVNVPNYEIATSDMFAIPGDGNLHFEFSRPTNGWPTGNYMFELEADGQVASSIGFKVLAYVPDGIYMPTASQLQDLAARTMDEFALAVNAADFTTLHAGCCSHFREAQTPASLLEIFDSYVSQKVDLTVLRGLEAVFHEEPDIIGDYSVLFLSGHYPTEPSQTQFELTYFFEDGAWRIIGLNVVLTDPTKN